MSYSGNLLVFIFFIPVPRILDSEWSKKVSTRSMPHSTADVTCKALFLITTWITLKNNNHRGEMDCLEGARVSLPTSEGDFNTGLSGNHEQSLKTSLRRHERQ